MIRVGTQGYVMLATLIGLTILAALALVYSTLTIQNRRDTVNVARSSAGFYAAEGGLNFRAQKVQSIFTAKLTPTPVGESPTAACAPGTAMGTQDFACDSTLSLGGRTVTTYMLDKTQYKDGYPMQGTVNTGERFGDLNYIQYVYRVMSEAKRPGQEGVEARVQMDFQSRLIPMFQFAAFYKKDLEINPGSNMTLQGRVHTNSNLYLSPGENATLGITGQVSAQKIYRGRKDKADCRASSTVSIQAMDSTMKTLTSCNGLAATQLGASDFKPFGSRLNVPGPKIEIPEPSKLDPSKDNELFKEADIRFVVTPNPSAFASSTIRVVNADGMTQLAATNYINGPECRDSTGKGPLGFSESLYDKRDREFKQLLDINQTLLMNCIQKAATNNPGTFKNAAGEALRLDDATGNGMAWHFSFGGPGDSYNKYETDSNGNVVKKATKFGIRVGNAAKLGSSVSGAPNIKGLTIVSNQSAYLQGDFNKNGTNGADWRPASVIADAINVLSNSWQDSTSMYAPMLPTNPPTAGAPAMASNTEINAAFLGGVDETKGTAYNGGLENYPRLHEHWRGSTLTYRGSFVSIGESSHTTSTFPNTCEKTALTDVRTLGTGRCVYQAPIRNFNYDTRFNDARNLPPLSPRFTYLRQIMFGRTYE